MKSQDIISRLPFKKQLLVPARFIWRLLPVAARRYLQKQNVAEILTPSIYPIEIPEINFKKNMDMILLELPQRYVPLRPNGLAHVHNILLSSGLRFQTVDVNMVMYHRYHQDRIINKRDRITTDAGYAMPRDPWETVSYEEWSKPEFLAYFKGQFQEVIDKLITARPKIIGISLSETNKTVAEIIVREVKKACPEIVILVGGYSCVYPYVAPKLFKDFDYMVIGEAEGVLPGLLKRITAGDKVRNLPGVISRYDAPDRNWTPGAIVKDLDTIEFPRYQWVDTNLYRSYNGQNTAPIISSRGCVWSRCRFCCECFPWRARDPVKVVDEIEWHVNNGVKHFNFNESDMNGNPDNTVMMCDEIIRRGLKIAFGGEMRIHKRNDRAFFEKLHKAGCGGMAFGVDGWTDRLIKLQNKGYSMALVRQNLQDCAASGISCNVNMVIGVPGETETDIDEAIKNIIGLKDAIGIFQNLNILSLSAGSQYYLRPQDYDIHFRKDRELLYAEYPQAIPPDLWYSSNPYIDLEVRQKRRDRIHKAIYDAGVNIGKYAEWQTRQEKQ